jgi:hypothetical protein
MVSNEDIALAAIHATCAEERQFTGLARLAVKCGSWKGDADGQRRRTGDGIGPQRWVVEVYKLIPKEKKEGRGKKGQRREHARRGKKGEVRRGSHASTGVRGKKGGARRSSHASTGVRGKKGEARKALLTMLL